jgi:hypothetical protein
VANTTFSISGTLSMAESGVQGLRQLSYRFDFSNYLRNSPQLQVKVILFFFFFFWREAQHETQLRASSFKREAYRRATSFVFKQCLRG